MTAEELRKLADTLDDVSEISLESRNAAATYLRACADALDAGFVRGAVLDHDGVALVRNGTELRRCVERGSKLLYSLALPGSLRLPEPMTSSEISDYARAMVKGDRSVDWLAMQIEAETIRRVKECNE